jgi:DNA-binding NtrC family response regulator
MMPTMKSNESGPSADLRPEPTKKSILLVDSEAHHRMILGSLLADEGYRVASCATLVDANVVLQLQEFDFVITDHSNSGINGLHVLEKVKRCNDKTPVLLISTLYETEPYLAAMNLGALDYLCKPVDYLEVQRLVRSH